MVLIALKNEKIISANEYMIVLHVKVNCFM